MKKIKITSEQYNTILLKEKNNRLNESFSNDKEVLSEGLKEILLGVASLMGVKLSGQNKEIANSVLKDDATLSNIKNTLEDETKVKDLAKSFGEKGMKNPELRLAKNAKKIYDSFNSFSSDKISNNAFLNLIGLDKELKKEYEDKLSEEEENKNTTSGETKTHFLIKDELVIILDTDVLFGKDDELQESSKKFMTSFLEELKTNSGEIEKIHIESSTDAEPNSKFISDDDYSGNITLAINRTNKITDILLDFDSGLHVTHTEIPNNGMDVVSRKDFTSNDNYEGLKSKTKKFRYIKIFFKLEFKTMTIDNSKAEEIVKDYRTNLLKFLKKSEVTIFDSDEFGFKNNKIKCKTKINPKFSLFTCTTFQI